MPVALRYDQITPADSTAVGTRIQSAEDGEYVDVCQSRFWPGGLVRRDASLSAATALADAIDDAVTRNLPVRLRAGRYRIGSAEQVALLSGTDLRGDGRGRTVLVPDADAEPDLLLANGSAASPLTDITVSGIGVDGAHRPADAGPAGGYGRMRFNYVHGLTLRDLDWRTTHGGLTLRAVERFDFAGLTANDVQEGVIAFLSGCKQGTLTGLNLHNVGEAIDFYNADDVVVMGLRASGGVWADDEGIDLSSSRHIVLAGLVLEGFPMGILVKTEGAVAWEDLTITDFDIRDFADYGIASRVYSDPTLGYPATACDGLRITDGTLRSSDAGAVGVSIQFDDAGTVNGQAVVEGCTVDVDGTGIESFGGTGLRVERNDVHSASGQAYAIGGSSSLPIRHPIIRGNRGSTDSATASHWTYNIISCLSPTVDGNEVTSAPGASGLRVRDCSRPVVTRNRVRDCGYHGIIVEWANAAYVDTTNLIIRGIVDDNEAWNWGSASPNRYGVRVNVAPSGETGVYSLLSIRGNQAYIDADGTLNGQIGVNLAASGVTLDYVSYDDNTSYRAPVGVQGTGLVGANGSATGNKTKT